MNNRIKSCLLALSACLLAVEADAQLSSNPDKFLGNITTSYQVDYGKEPFHTLWNQITPENETKWDAIEGQGRGIFNWSGADRAANYAKQHGFPFKFHTLIWGAQYPTWMDRLSTEEQYKAIVEWMDAIKKHYPNLEVIDVVNEAISGHQPAPYRAALGGEGKTGYDWIIKAFEMTHERWPDAILVYNDYNTFQWQRTEFINLVRTLRDAGAPIDAYGCQSHDLTGMNVSDFKAAMVEIQQALQMPMYSTEYDIGTPDDALQLQRYKEQIPYMWEADYCAGVTLWGYIYGKTWTTDGNSGIIRDGKDRPAMEWLRQYMATEKAQKAKSPFPGMKKEASVYVKPSTLTATKGEPVEVQIDARLRTKTIDHIDFYVKGQKQCTLTEAPYVASYTPSTLGKHTLKAIVVATDGTQYTRLSGFTVYGPRSPFRTIELPGCLEVEDFDKGSEGLTYHDSDTKNEGGANYRTDAPGVDIIRLADGYAIGYTAQGEWLEYTVDVKEEGMYLVDVYAATGSESSSISLSILDGYSLTDVTGNITIPCVKKDSWSDYSTVRAMLKQPLKAGRNVIRLTVTGAYCNVDRLDFTLANRNPYQGQATVIPGILEFENFDEGVEGLTFHDIDMEDEGKAGYRTDNGGVDIVATANGYAVGYTAQDEWLEYTIDVQQAGDYEFRASVASGLTGAGFRVDLVDEGVVTQALAVVKIPQTADNSWETYKIVEGKFSKPLAAGRQTLRFTITGPYANLDKIKIWCPAAGIEAVAADDACDAPMYDLTGRRVGLSYRGMAIRGGQRIMIR